MRSRRDKAKESYMVAMEKLLAIASSTASMPGSDLFFLVDRVDCVTDYLVDVINDLVEDYGFSSWNEANEGSECLSKLMFVQMEVDEIRWMLDEHASKFAKSNFKR